jgi:hypothetical protein
MLYSSTTYRAFSSLHELRAIRVLLNVSNVRRTRQGQLLPRTTTLRISNILSTTTNRKYTLEELRNKIRRGSSTISQEELRRVANSVFRSYTECIWSGGKICSICYSTLGFLRGLSGKYPPILNISRAGRVALM